MGRVRTTRFWDRENGVAFQYNVSVNQQGEFSTTLPKDIVAILDEAKVKTGKNRLGNFGYFTSDTLDGISVQVKDAIAEAFSRELVEQKIVIEYAIETAFSYCIGRDGEIAPNGGIDWCTPDEYKWISGTLERHATSPCPFSLSVYVEPAVSETYKYKSGRTVVELAKVRGNLYAEPIVEADPYLKWLVGVTSMNPDRNMKLKYMDYSESVAKFFVELLKGMCVLGEKMSMLARPDQIKSFIDNGGKLLLPGKDEEN
jgi:hypothetical protein